MDISAEVAAIQAASQGSELRQPLVGALNKLNTGSLPTVTASDAGKILKVDSDGEWVAGEKSGYMPVPTDSIIITENGVVNVLNYANANVNVQGSGGSTPLDLISAYFTNGGSSGSDISHTFNSGNYAVVIATTNGKAITDLNVLLNNSDIISNITAIRDNSSVNIYAYMANFNNGDTIAISNKTSVQNSGVQLFIFSNLNIATISFFNNKGNGEGTFTINASSACRYFEVSKYGYYNGLNTIPSVMLFRLISENTDSIATPNTSAYYAGGTYVLQIDD